MGITIVQKSDVGQPRNHSKVALVLAGGAITGGAYKLGGLLALDRFLGRRSVNDFDIYVGISAGAFLAAPLAAGIHPIELFRAASGRSQQISPFRWSHFYWPNLREFAQKPARFLRDSALYSPKVLRTLARSLLYHRRTIVDDIRRSIRRDPDSRWFDAVSPVLEEIFQLRPFPLSLDYLPSGLFDNSRIERFVRENLERAGLPNRFRLLRVERGASLYIGATNLQNGRFEIFGPDEDNSVTISQAVQASTAIPGFFRPARIGGRDYIDGGISKTASMSVAAAKGADLIIAYNPFRPYAPVDHPKGRETHRLADASFFSVFNQAFRTLLHTRLHIGLEKLRLDPKFRGDIILIEPSPSDEDFFHMNPINFWRRIAAAEKGYRSVKDSLESEYAHLQRILRTHGFEPDLVALQGTLERIEVAEAERSMIEALEDDEARAARARARPRLEVVS